MNALILLLISADPASALARLAPGEWIEYRVPLADPRRAPCCFNREFHRAACSLENRHMSYGTSDDDPQRPGEMLTIYARRSVKNTRVDRVLVVGSTCPVTSGSARVTAIDVSPADSAAFLEHHTRDANGEESRDEALGALAHSGGAAATEALIRFTRPSENNKLRQQAYFWLALTRGAEGYDVVRAAIDREDGQLRKHLIFCASQSETRTAEADLSRLAREHTDDDVRAEALFWIAQKKKGDAESIIRSAIDRDPSTEVRKKAIFAASKLPADRAVPLLRKLVEGNGPRALRKEALFWLAQIDDDDEVLRVFDEMLAK